MRILILRSRRRRSGGPADEYTQTFGGAYAEKVIGNLVGERGFCASCADECAACREPYDRRFGPDIAAVIDLPGELPYLLEDPGQYVPADVPPHDVLLAINIHEQVLLEFLKRCGQWGTRGAVVPVESGDWVSGSARKEAEGICEAAGLEVAFPKPFCAFDPPAGTVLAEFRGRFHVGRPSVELTVREGRIERAYVHVSAACGATYYVARWLAGRRVEDDLKYEVISKRLHSYPCTASMAWDDELGDTILHVAGEAHYEILAPLADSPEARKPEMVVSPTGRMVPAPAPFHENVENIERAKQAVLDALAESGSASLADLRNRPGVTAAALSSAVLLLKQAGKVRTEGGRILRT